MEKFKKLLFFCYFLFIGCSTSGKIFKTNLNTEYKVIDKGNHNVTIISKSCSIFAENANFEARRSAKYQLRSVIGSHKHRKKIKKIRTYKIGQKTCVEILAKGLKHL
tara:strand:- start:2778 stop:3098 length:321 start_codon:yes stop_codon:yes gene_type:complete